MNDIMCQVPVINKSKISLRFVLRSILHLLCVCVYLSVLGYGGVMALQITEEQSKYTELIELKYYTPFFLTNWNFIFQTVFLTLSLIYDSLEWLDKHETRLAKKLQYFRDVIFSGLVFPYALFISTMFWTLFWIDRELVFPLVYDQVIPWWFNHCVHTNITIVVIIETLIQPRRHPTDFKLELILNGIVGIAYAIVYYSIYFFANRWLYGVFGLLTWWQVCLYQLLIWGSCYVFYFIQFPINRLFHKKEGVLNTPVPTTEVKEDIQPELLKNRHENGSEKNGDSHLQDPNFSTNPLSLKHRLKERKFENSSL